MMLDNVDRLTAQITALDATIEQVIAPFAAQVAQLDEVTGIGLVAAQDLIAEIGVDMSRFPSDAHLVSWAKFCPQVHQSAGKRKNKGRGKGSPWLAAILGNIAATATRTDSFLGARYRRIARRRGKQKAIVAVGNSVLVIHRLPPAVRSQPALPRPGRRPLPLADQQGTPRPQPGRPTPGGHRPNNHHPRRQGHHHPTPSRLTAHTRTRLRFAAPGAAACPLTVGFSGQMVKLSEWARRNGVHYQTAWSWAKKRADAGCGGPDRHRPVPRPRTGRRYVRPDGRVLPGLFG
jgi:hypothetical protein